VMWASDTVNGGLSKLDWPRLQGELADHRESWIKAIIDDAKRHDEFFPIPEQQLRDEYDDED
jgi:hypothetical protein